jgi:DNA repair protein RadC
MHYTLKDHDMVVGEYHTDYVLRVRDLAEEDKPREKLTTQGPQGLSAAELVAVVLGVGTRKEEVLSMSQRIIKEYGEKAIIHETRAQRLAHILDIPENKACQLVACFELGRRAFAEKSGKPQFIRNPEQAYTYLKNMASASKEQLRGLYLNSRHEVVHDEIISIGSLTANIVHPREVFQPAIEHGAVAVIIAHNHPSGNVQPTKADTEVTAQLVDAGKILGIDLIDHIIITELSYCSIMEQ